jgi:Protein of unknown function (DUF3048) N-terminal domain/Protein of unknown function (DUF3048) C-terminal domain/Bacterial Ig-like domain
VSSLPAWARGSWIRVRAAISTVASWSLGLDPRVRVGIAAALLLAVVGGATLAYLATRPPLPTTASMNLREGTKEVALDQKLVFATSRPVDFDDFRDGLRISPAMEGALAGSPDGRRFIWTPTRLYADLTRYTVSLKSIEDSTGHRVQAARWHFTTTIVPRVVELSTRDGAGVAPFSEIRVGTPLQVRFNVTMDAASVKVLNGDQPVPLGWAADHRTVGLDPAGLGPGQALLSMAPGARDAERRALADWRVQVAYVTPFDVHTVPLRTPALIQIPNDPAARDQAGMQAASMVYEYETEGHITRFTAIYDNAPDLVGNIRSMRLISIALTRHYRGMLLASGASNGTLGRLYADPVPVAINDGPSAGFFFRSGGRPAPHNLYMTGGAIAQAVNGAGLEQSTIRPGPLPVGGGGDGGAFDVPQHHTSYRYDPGTATYLKASDGRDLIDAAIGQPVHIRMVIVLHTTARGSGYPEDVNGEPGLEFDTESGGGADYFLGGRHYTGHWISPGRNAPFVFQLDDGSPVTPSPSLTWVDVVQG